MPNAEAVDELLAWRPRHALARPLLERAREREIRDRPEHFHVAPPAERRELLLVVRRKIRIGRARKDLRNDEDAHEPCSRSARRPQAPDTPGKTLSRPSRRKIVRG